ncbi:ABC transporter substrate-binding protein [Thermodesulfobacteriota bacterium]
MGKRVGRKSVIVFGLVALLITLPLTVASAAKLKVGFLADFTGPAAVMSAPAANGVMDYLKYVNDKKGGVSGNPIDIDWLDAKFKPALALDAYHRMVDQNALCVVAMNSPYVKGTMPFIVKDKMPLVTLANNLPFVYKVTPKFPSEWVYGTGGCAAEEYTSFVQWALDNWGKNRPIRLVLAYPDNSYGKALLQAFPEWVQKKQGVEVVGKEIVPMNPDDATPYLVKIKGHNPDYVLLRLMANGIAIFLKDAPRVGMKAPIIGNYVGKSGDIERLVASPELLDQFMIANLFGVLEDKGSWGMDLAKKLAQKYQGKELKKIGSMYWWGVGVGMIIEEALRVAVKSVGAEKLNSALMKEKGFDSVANLDTGGIMGTVTIKPGDHRSIVQHRIIGYQKGKLKILRNWADNVSILK